MEFDVEQGGWRRKSLLLALAGVHLAALVLWRQPLQLPLAPPQRITWLLLLPDTARQRTAPQAPRPQARAVPPARMVAQSPAQTAPPPTLAQRPAEVAPAAAPQAISAPPVGQPSDYFATTPVARESALEAAKRSAGAVDRQLRKEAWNPRDKFVANAQSALAGRMAAAYQGNDGVTYEEVTLPDGRQMTKVHAGGATYCAYKESNGLVGGRDVFKDGVKTAVSTCPK